MQVDELQLRFKINERALLDGLIKSASTVSDEFADELSKKFEAAINKVTKSGRTVMQLGGLFVGLFNEFSEAAGDVDKLSSAMDNLVNRFEFLSNIEKKSGVKGLLNEFNVANIDKLLDYYDKMYEAEEKIQKIREKNNRELIKQNAQKKVRSADDLLKMGRGEKDDSKDLRDYVKKYIDNAVKENEKLKPASAEDANKLLAVSRQYADLVSAYKKLLQEAPKKGSEEAVTQQLEIISILTELKKYEQQNVVLADFRKNIEKELPDDFKNIQKEASTIEVQGLTLAINNMVTALVKPLQTQIAKIYEEAIEKATGIAVKKGEDIMQTYEEAVKVFNLQEEKAPASKKRVGIAKKIPTQFGGVGSAGTDNIEEEINEFAKYYKSLEDAKQHIADLLNDRNVKATTVDSNNFEKIKDLIGYIQGYISLGGQIDDLNLDKTTLRRFNLQGMSTNYANQISAIKNTIIDAFKQVAVNNYGTAGNAEVVNAAVANDVSTNPNANITGGILSDDSAQKILGELSEIKEYLRTNVSNSINSDIISSINALTDYVKNANQNNIPFDYNLLVSNLQHIKDTVDKIYSVQAKSENTQFHQGNLRNLSKTFSNDNFGNMIDDLLYGGINERGYGYGSGGTGIYTTKNTSDIHRFNSKDKKDKNYFGYAIDFNQYDNLFTPKSESEAINALSFLSKLEAYAIKLGSNYDKFDEALNGVDAESLFNDYQNVFKNGSITFDEFQKFINEMSELVKTAGKIDDNKFSDISTDLSHSDNIATRFMKMNGYGGFDVHNIESLDNHDIGSVVYDIKPESIIREFSNYDELIEYAETISKNITQKLSTSIEEFKTLGVNAADGYITGLTEAVPKVMDATEAMIDAGIIAAANAQESNSPSKKYQKLGNDAADGYITGIREKIDDVKNAASDLVNNGFKNATSSEQSNLLSDNEKKYNEIISDLKAENEEIKKGNKLFQERNIFLDESNNKIKEIKGQYNEVDTTPPFGLEHGKIIHTHPDENYGGHASISDVVNWGEMAKLGKIDSAELIWRNHSVNMDFSKMTEDGIDEFVENYSHIIQSIVTHFGEEVDGEQGKYRIPENISDLVNTYIYALTKPLAESLGGKVTSDLDIGVINNNILSGINSLYNQIIALINSNLSPELQETEFNRLRYNYRHSSNETPVLTEPDEPINQDSSPTLIKVKPAINPQEFADEVSEQLIGYNAQVNVAPKTEDPNLFVTEVSQSLNGWNANISVQPEINEPSRFAESVSEQIQFSPAQIPVDPLSEGQFDAEGFAQKVTNRLIGETAKIDVEIGEIKNRENINIDSLKGAIDSVQQQINSKDDAFVNEKEIVDSSIVAEITKLNELKDVIEGVTKSVNEKTEAFKNEAKTVESVLSEESRSENNTNTKKKNKSSKNKQEEYDEEYAKVLSSAMSDAEENLKREEEERRRINELRAEGIKQEQEFYKHQGENQKALQKYSQQLFNLSKDSNLEKYPTIYRELLSNINDEIDRINGLDIIKDEDLEEIKELFDGLNDINKLASGANVSNYIVKLEKILEKNTKMSPETRAKFESYILQLKNNAELTKNEFRDIVEETNKVEANMIKAGEAGKGLLTAIKDKAFYRTAQYIASFFSFQDIIRYARQAISTVRELDTALVDLRKTTTMSNAELNKFYYESNNIAKQMGVTTKEIIEQASSWSRLGYNTSEASKQMAQLSSQFASISPGMSTEESQSGLVSIMKAWKIDPEEVEREIMDPINTLGKKILPKHTAMYGVVTAT